MEYEVAFEIAGPSAMFNRPDVGAGFVSYPAPTYSAAKGMFESVMRLETAYIRPTKCEICAPVVYHKYVTNYGGPQRKNPHKQGSYQLVAMILVNVCYRIYGTVVEHTRPKINSTGKRVNHLHMLQDKFLRRLRTGRFFNTPCLGWREFQPSYFGPFRDGTHVMAEINEYIPTMLERVFDAPINGKRLPYGAFRQGVWIRNGVLHYDQ